jgi:hypothetical protein
VFPETVSRTISVHVPVTFLPLKAASGWAGLNMPLNGAVPLAMPADAVSLNSVPVMLAPLPPTLLNSCTSVPSGPCRNTVRSAMCGCVMFSRTPTAPTRNGSVTVRLEVRSVPVLSGMAAGSPDAA